MPKAKRQTFPKVQEARALLAERAVELIDTYTQLIKDAIAAEDFGTAKQGLEFLIKHMPKSPEDEGMIDSSVDTAPQAQAAKQLPGAPQIRIGVAIGGMPGAKELPPAVVDVVDITPESDNG